MRTTIQILLIVMMAFSAAGLSAPAVLAAAPTNDVISGATLVSPGFSETLDTSQATTDTDDAQLNTFCGAPATDASVWYTLQGTDQGVIVDVSQSNYSAGVLVGVGSQGSLDIVACGPGAVAFFAASGVTYYILAIDDQLLDGGGNGGTLNISFNLVPPPPTLSINVNPYGSFDSKTGIAAVSGTYTCTDGGFIAADIQATQEAGRFTVLGAGSFFYSGTCDGASHNWAAQIYPQAGKFAGGYALTVTFSYACGSFDCSYGYTEQTVILRGKKK